MNDLKPCPFCKDEVYPQLITKEQTDFCWFAWYKCPECDCNQIGVSEYDDEDPKQSAIDMARERWNERYERTCHIVNKTKHYDDIVRTIELSCGCYVRAADVVMYCPKCGAKVEVE